MVGDVRCTPPTENNYCESNGQKHENMYGVLVSVTSRLGGLGCSASRKQGRLFEPRDTKKYLSSAVWRESDQGPRVKVEQETCKLWLPTYAVPVSTMCTSQQ